MSAPGRGPLGPGKAPWLGLRRLRWRTLRLRDAVVLTLPVWLVLAWTLGSAVRDYQRLLRFDDWWSQRNAELPALVSGQLTSAARTPQALALRLRLDAESADPAVVRLRVGRSEWALWQSEPLALWDVWVDAERVRGPRFDAVEIRKRGDTSVHWVTAKKSFTLKTPRDGLLAGYRRLAFSVKTVIPQLVSNGLASEFGVLAPYTTAAAVFVNDRFYGLHRLSEVIDESFLRRRGRLPGNVFRGDTAERGESFKDLPRWLPENPYIWDRVAENDRPSAPPGSILFDFLRAVNGDTFEDHLRLLRLVDEDEIARLLAYLLVTGDPYHLTNLHNQFWYEDPASGTLHPIPWDVRLRDLAEPPPHDLNRFLRAVLRSPAVLARTMETLAAELEEGSILPRAEALLDDLLARHADHVAYERLRDERVPGIGSPEEARALLRGNLELLARWRDDARVRRHAETPAAGPALLDLEAGGYAPVELRALEIGIAGASGAPRLLADRNRSGRPDAGDARVPGAWSDGTLRLDEPEPLLAGVDPASHQLAPEPIAYRYFVLPPDGGRIRAVRAVLANRLTGAPVAPRPWPAGTPIAAAHSWHPWRHPVAAPAERRLAGAVHLRETLRVGERETLVIEPGTTLRLGPDVSILARGRVIARGEPRRPIAFLPAEPGRPWGTLALQGRGADGSVFEHVRFEAGGGAVLDRVEYKGMVSVHRVRDVRFDRCTFSGNLRSDDALNAVHSQVALRESVFLRANADAVDYDYSDGLICGCRFEASGNDAIDLMTSSPRILGNHISVSGDKGISIGERSHPFVFANAIVEGQIGVEVKDGSEPWLLGNQIAGNGIGVLQNVKNWRYGAGGFAKLFGPPASGNARDYAADARSRVTRTVRYAAAEPTGSPEPAAAGGGSPSRKDGAGELGWLLARHGVAPEPAGAGYLAGPPAPPVVETVFAEDFASATDGWAGSGGVDRLMKRDANLVVSLRRGRAAIARALDWDLSDPAPRYVAVLEVSGRGFEDATAVFASERGERAVPIEATGDPRRYALAAVELDPGRYRELRIEATPVSATARLELHRVAVHALPEDAAAAPACRFETPDAVARAL